MTQERDKFDLLLSLSLMELGTPEAQRQLAGLEQEIVDLFNVAARVFGHTEARRLFREAARRVPGKQADRLEHAYLFAKYDDELASGAPKKSAAIEAAKKVVDENQGRNSKYKDPENVARQIRRLVKARADERAAKAAAEKAEAELRMKIPPSLLEQGSKDSDV